jgi:peptidoglycan L-alanyl-D-glutamate endopeptidase CwlK
MVIERRVDILLPEFKDRLLRGLAKAQAAGHKVAVFETWRGPVRQEELYAQGRTTRGPKVTNARAWESFHQYGVASDIAGFVDGQWTWDPKVINFTEAMKFFKAEGLETLDPFEQLHVQLTAGLKIAEAKMTHTRLGLLGVWAEILRRVNGAMSLSAI